MAIEIRLAQTEEELKEIYRFRYEIYVEELGYKLAYTDHERKVIVDPLDKTARIIGAFEEGKVVGTIRLNYARDSDMSDHTDLYSLHWAGEYHPYHTAVTERFMVANRFRGGSLGIRLAEAAYRMAHSDRIEFIFIGCKSHLVEFFLSMGFRPHRENVKHPGIGEVTLLVFVVSDLRHLEQVRSPLAKICREFPTSEEAVNFFNTDMLPRALAA
jgi:predicted GNAT family N-acyltransferase